jgi:4-carboxymuconolactone decarboxylase
MIESYSSTLIQGIKRSRVEKLRKVDKTGKPSRRDVMKSTATLMIAALWGADTAFTQEKRMTDTKQSNALPSVLSYDDVRAVSPALEHYTKGPLLDALWKRPELSPRDRSVVTVAALIARIQTIEMPFHFALALDNGVKPSELSEIITHLAFYSGWANAMSAVAVAKDIFHQRGIGVDQLPPAKEKLLPLNEEAEKQRAIQVSGNFGATSPGLVENTTNLLFLDLWLRPALAPRDRSLVTVSSLIASAQVAQITYHLGRAMDDGLTQVQASEVLTHIAFYAGWPNAFSALPVVKDVFEKRQKQ